MQALGRRDAFVRISGLVLTFAASSLLAWVLATQPATMADVGGGLAASVGLYRIDQAAFAEGLQYFRDGQVPRSAAGLCPR